MTVAPTYVEADVSRYLDPNQPVTPSAPDSSDQANDPGERRVGNTDDSTTPTFELVRSRESL